MGGDELISFREIFPDGVLDSTILDGMAQHIEQHNNDLQQVIVNNEIKWVPNEHNNQRYAKAYEAGKLAHQQGYAAGSNPHAMITQCMIEAIGWMAGWMDGMNEAINAVAVPHVPGRRAVRIA